MSKNIKLEENKFNSFSEQDVIDGLEIVNQFSSCLNSAKSLFSMILLKSDLNKVKLDKETLELVVDWSKSFVLLSERMKCFEEGTKPN